MQWRREPSRWTTGWDICSGLWDGLLAWLSDARVPMATTTSGTVNDGWVTCQLSPHLTQALWIHSSLEKTAAMYLQAEDKTVILV